MGPLILAGTMLAAAFGGMLWLGDLFHARFAYLQAWGADADESVWRFDAGEAGSGALGDLASHVVDLARFLVGEIDVVTGLEQRFVEGRAVRRQGTSHTSPPRCASPVVPSGRSRRPASPPATPIG